MQRSSVVPLSLIAIAILVLLLVSVGWTTSVEWMLRHIAASSAAEVSLVSVSATIAALGIWLQLLGGLIARGAAPAEWESLSTTTQWTLLEDTERMMRRFERDLVADWGATLNSTGILLTFASGVAAIGIAFPEHWKRFVVIIPLSLLPALFGLLWSVSQMCAKRTRQQNIFDILPNNPNPGPRYPVGRLGKELRTNRAYWVDRVPSLATWRTKSRWQERFALVGEMLRLSRVYLSNER
jgi:hypothetical protein